jgi:hypothetical protein
MYSNDDFAVVARTLWYLCADKSAPAFPPWCRGKIIHAKLLLEAPDDLSDSDIEDDPFEEEEYSILELVRRCVARRVFDNDGLEFLCNAVGEPFQRFPDDPTEEERAAQVSLKRSLSALAIAHQELHCASRRRTEVQAAGA